MPEIMIAMILISLLPTTNNIPNDYQGKRTATLAVPKGKDFIFQVLQVYELKKKLLSVKRFVDYYSIFSFKKNFSTQS